MSKIERFLAENGTFLFQLFIILAIVYLFLDWATAPFFVTHMKTILFLGGTFMISFSEIQSIQEYNLADKLGFEILTKKEMTIAVA